MRDPNNPLYICIVITWTLTALSCAAILTGIITGAEAKDMDGADDQLKPNDTQLNEPDVKVSVAQRGEPNQRSYLVV